MAEEIERHIAERNAVDDHFDEQIVPNAAPIASDDFGSGDTRVNYLPNEPREPATSASPCRARGCLAPLNSSGICTVHFADAERTSAPDLPPPPSRECPPSIAELFQDMLRQAFTAGLAAAQSAEAFETWYQREVLQ
jgi:hypothetical protein